MILNNFKNTTTKINQKVEEWFQEINGIAEKFLEKTREMPGKEGEPFCHGYEKNQDRLLMVHIDKQHLRIFFKDSQWTKTLKVYEEDSFPCGWGTKTPLTRYKYIKNENDFKESLELIKSYLSAISKNQESEAGSTPEKIFYHWYILFVRSGKEEKIIEDIKQKLAEKKAMKTGVNDLKIFSDANQKKVIKGYILGYLHLTTELVRFFYSIPGVISFLNHKRSEEKLPDFVSEKIINNFFAKIQERKEIKIASHDSNLNVGDLVRITEGTFTNYEGRITHLDEKKRKVKITIESSGWEVTDVPLKVCQKILG